MKRVIINLTQEEKQRKRQLKQEEGEALFFWGEVAIARGLDWKTIIWDDGFYHALPLNHKKHWCWPLPLKCKYIPKPNEEY